MWESVNDCFSPNYRCDSCTLYSGLVIIGGSHSPSISLSQSSGFLASGSGMFSALSQSCQIDSDISQIHPGAHPSGKPALASGLVSSGSGIFSRSSQSSGFLASGSLIFFGGRKSQSSSKVPDSTFLLSIFTSYVLSGLTIRVYKWVNSSS